MMLSLKQTIEKLKVLALTIKDMVQKGKPQCSIFYMDSLIFGAYIYAIYINIFILLSFIL